jgi:hypothetical protein
MHFEWSYKRLEKGRFRWPEAESEESKITLSHEELMLLLGGIDLAQTRRRAWHRVIRADKPTRFLEHPELELSNNSAENSMRPVVLGRKNWIHPGSEQAGPKVAAILSVVETCRRLRLPVREYLAGVLPGLGSVPVRRVPQYTPAAWAASRSWK